MEPYPPAGRLHSRPDLDQLEPQRPCLSVLEPCSFSSLLEQAHQHGRRRMQEQPELVGPEAMTRRAPARQIDLHLFDPVLPVSPLAVELVYSLRLARPVGHHVPHIELSVDGFRLADPPPLPLPALRRVMERRVAANITS